MTIIIESASIQHLNVLYEIERRCFGREAFARKQIANLLTDYNSIGLIAKLDEKIVGFIIASIYVERNAPVGHILTIDVAPECRRMGIGFQLLSKIEGLFKEKGVRNCYLEVREDNQAALNLYMKLGYCKAGKIEGYYGNASGIHLRKALM
jgi:ribosomal-protein-alanine N-acetyltransferase